jgi:hypothetical protein
MKHNNKHWLREKEYYSLKKSYYSDFYCSGTSIEYEIEKRLYSKFWNQMFGLYHTAPKHYRKSLNRVQRAKSKQVLHKIIKGYDSYIFEDNYKDAPWYW